MTGNEVAVTQDVSIVGVGMTAMDRRDLTPEALARAAVRDDIADAGLGPGTSVWW